MSRIKLALLTVALGLVLGLAGRGDAGITPENVVVVVNGNSIDSRTVANHYVAARKIPSGNVIVLDDVPDGLKVGLEPFRERILRPLLEQIDARKLSSQVFVVAYSAGFPTTVEISAHKDQLSELGKDETNESNLAYLDDVKKYLQPSASITGLTFFYQAILADSPSYLLWDANRYARGKFARHFINPFAGEMRLRFDDAVQALEQDRAAEAAAIFAELHEKHPTLSPLAMRAAESYVQAEDMASAKTWLINAIRSGWVSANYIRESETLGALREDPTIRSVSDKLSDAPIAMQGPLGFSSLRGWTANGSWVRPREGGMHYLLSCMLGVVHERGSTVDQAVKVLERAATSDLTHPVATVGFSKTSDVRSTTRFPNFGDALVWLQERGHDTEVFTTRVPTDSQRYVGLMLGSATLDLAKTNWQFVPGAIAESFTSHGGNFSTSSQSKLTRLLHHGAAISSGSVVEPFSLQVKFPLPMMHAYYAEGVSAIEAYYLSVSSPAQLLIVGDPLCQPFARPPNERLEIVADDSQANRFRIDRSMLNLRGEATQTREVQVFIEGKLVQSAKPMSSIGLNLPAELSGSIVITAVLIGADPTEPRIGFSKWVDLIGPQPIPTAEVATRDAADYTDAELKRAEIAIAVECKGADRIELFCGAESLGQIDGDSGMISLDPAQLGDGPIRVRPIASFETTRVPGRELAVSNTP